MREQETKIHYNIFLSYSRKDLEMAMKIKSAVQSLGYTTFYDSDELEGERDWRKSIAQSIENCDCFLFLQTESSVSSQWCQRELNIADDSEKNIIPVVLKSRQQDLPKSDEVKLTLAKCQTTFISDSLEHQSLKNDLKDALLKSAGVPDFLSGDTILTEFCNKTADILNHQYKAMFTLFGCPDIISDYTGSARQFKWKFKTAMGTAVFCVALNSYSCRPVCYSANLQKCQDCTLYKEKNRKEYSLEGYVVFDHSRMEKQMESLLDLSGDDLCRGSKTCKYFFREKILDGIEVSSGHDFQAVLLFIAKADDFFRNLMNSGKLKQFMACFNEIRLVLNSKSAENSIIELLNGEHSDWRKSEKQSPDNIHFYDAAPPDELKIPEEKLGRYTSVAIAYPHAIRLFAEDISEQQITLSLCHYQKDRLLRRKHIVKISGELLEKLQKKYHLIPSADPDEQSCFSEELFLPEIKKALAEIKDSACTKSYSELPEQLHELVQTFCKENSVKMGWTVLQDQPDKLTLSGKFKRSAAQPGESCYYESLKFVMDLELVKDGTVKITRSIKHPFPQEPNSQYISVLTGFPADNLNVSVPDCAAFFRKITGILNKVHGKLRSRFTLINHLDLYLCTWKNRNAGGYFFRNHRCDPFAPIWQNSLRTNEVCWDHVLSPNVRFCRIPNKSRLPDDDFTFALCVRFANSGLHGTTIGILGGDRFKQLELSAKRLFWQHLKAISKMELTDSVVIHENGNSVYFSLDISALEPTDFTLPDSEAKKVSGMEMLFDEAEKLAGTLGLLKN